METDTAAVPERKALEKPRSKHNLHETIASSASRSQEKAAARIGQSKSDGVVRRKRWEAFRQEQAKLLEIVASGCALKECLLALIRAVERLLPNSRAAVLTADEACAKIDRTFSAGISTSFGEAIHGAPIGELLIGTCGMGIFKGEPVTCADIRTDDRWADMWRDLCMQHGILASHSTPAMGPGGKAVASFLLAFAEAHEPDEYERRIGEFGARIAGIALGHDRASRALRESEAHLSAELEDARLLQGISGEMIRGERVERLYEKIMDAAVGIMQSDFASLQMLDPERGDRGELRLLAFRGFDPEAARFWEWVGADSESGCGEAFRRGKRVIVPDVENCEFMAGSEVLTTCLQSGIRAVQCTPLTSRSGKLVGMISTHWKQLHTPSERGLRALDVLVRQAADLIERRQTVERIRQSQERLMAAVTASGSGTFRWNPHTDEFLDFDGNLKRLFGRGPETEFRTADDFIHLVHPEDRQTLAAAVDACRRGADFSMEFRVMLKDRSVRWLYGRAKMTWEHGLPAYLTGACTDVTSRKEAELSALEAAERFRFLAETMPQKIFTAKPNGDVDYFNPQWMEYTGLSVEQIKDWGWVQFIHPDDVEENVRVWKRSLETGAPFQIQHRFRRADGEYRWHYSRALPFRDADGNVKLWIGTNTDVEDRRRSEEVMLRTEKLAAAGRLAATVAHEINNPLESITNLLYLASQDEEMTAPSREYLQMAGAELNRVAQVARQTLGFYRDTVAPGWLDITAHINELLEMYKYKLRDRDVRLESDGEAKIFAPAGEFRQIFSNLLVNAADATQSGSGRIRIRVRVAGEGNGFGRQGVRITVADNGCGIPGANKARVFEAFYTTKRDVGTGLGLWLSRKLAQKHGASLRVRSRARLGDSGTVFSVLWPVATPRGVETSAEGNHRPVDRD